MSQSPVDALVSDALYAREVLVAQYERHGATAARYAAWSLTRSVEAVAGPLPPLYCVDYGARLRWRYEDGPKVIGGTFS